jgi:hypothetical protein
MLVVTRWTCRRQLELESEVGGGDRRGEAVNAKNTNHNNTNNGKRFMEDEAARGVVAVEVMAAEVAVAIIKGNAIGRRITYGSTSCQGTMVEMTDG